MTVHPLVRQYYLNVWGWLPCPQDPLDRTDPRVVNRWLNVNLDGEPVGCTLSEYCIADWQPVAVPT